MKPSIEFDGRLLATEGLGGNLENLTYQAYTISWYRSIPFVYNRTEPPNHFVLV